MKRAVHASLGLARLAVAAAGAGACAPGAGPPPRARVAVPAPATTPAAAVDLVSCVDLPRDDVRSHNLSGLAWDDAEHRLYAISDRDPWLTVLEPRPGFAGFALGERLAIDVGIGVEQWDGEALALANGRFLLVASETLPVIFEVDRSGRGGARIEMPEFRGIRDNLGIEGIAYAASAEGRFVFAINEEALDTDGPLSSTARGTRVRIVRRSLGGGPVLAAVYLTDPIFTDGERSDNGVSDLAALSPDRLLVLERAYVQGRGNAARIYEIDLRGAQGLAAQGDAEAAQPVTKRLLLDVAALPDAGCSEPLRPQRRRTLENYEGLALGPVLPDGRRAVFLISDDNERPTQIPRVLTLAIAPGAL